MGNIKYSAYIGTPDRKAMFGTSGSRYGDK